jgi:Sec1 family
LLLAYVISREGISDADRQNILQATRLSQSENQALTNLSVLNVKLSAAMDRSSRDPTKNPFSMAENIRRSNGVQAEFENSRFVPTVSYILRDLVNNNLDTLWFPWLKGPPVETSAAAAEPAPRKVKASWAKAKRAPNTPVAEELPSDPRSYGPRVIVFCIGGVAPSEIVAFKKLQTETSRAVMIGTLIITKARRIYGTPTGLLRV